MALREEHLDHRAEVRGDVAQLRTEFRKEISELRAEIRRLSSDLITVALSAGVRR